MDLYKELNLTPVRTEPDVWVKRLVVFERIAPTPQIIRDVSLTRGLNIVWAEETDEDNPEAEISGHSAGKTTFCRLLRYVLGERTFGTKANTELIKKSIPDGYVAAEINVAGRHWAVRRPIGVGRLSYVKQDATIEDFLQEHGESVSQEEYPRKIGLDGLLDNFETGAVVRTGELIQWGHILAWCTRDQEARFQNIHDWRSPRSESEAPTLRFSKGGSLFVMRTALGLFFPDELKGEENLARLQREKDQLEKEIEEKRREPQFRVNLYDQELRRRLKAVLADEQDIDELPFRSDDLLPDLQRLVGRAVTAIKEETPSGDQERADLQNQIDEMGAQIRKLEGDLEELNVLFELNTATGTELDDGLFARDSERQRLKENEDRLCPYGGVLIRECSYVVDRQQVLQFRQLQDVRAMEQAETDRRNEVEKIELAKTNLRESIQKLRNRRSDLQAKRDSLGRQLLKGRERLNDLMRTHEALELWTQRSEQEQAYPELSEMRKKLDEINNEIERLEKELTTLLQRHDQNRRLLASIFSKAVQAVLSDHYDGQVDLDNRELAFRITHGPAMSGEAIETLCVLLSDFASLIYNTVSDASHLPGLMLHDSPREADLGLRIYRSFIRFIASVIEGAGGNDSCPFQYVLTTTTPPPEELREAQFVKLRLNASKLDTLLLRRNIAEVPNDGATLFSPAN